MQLLCQIFIFAFQDAVLAGEKLKLFHLDFGIPLVLVLCHMNILFWRSSGESGKHILAMCRSWFSTLESVK